MPAVDYVRHEPPPCAVAPAFDLAVRVGDGVRGLGRVINVLALLDITPLELSAVEAEGELEVRARITAEGDAARLGLQRLRVLPCVRSAWLAARNVEAAPYLTTVC
ncbi:hypothetical protein LJR219_004192 [Phenylobacterium sp. LjRoot219]|uniref:hypothetical protein n=1 Tax=Phenylobacterium sp. LjRoot219 TaxID=3342283 RepID=UPI003ECC624C